MSSLSNAQLEICEKFGAPYFAAEDHLKIGIATTFDPAEFPVNGLRHPPEGDTTGWYIWSGEEFPTEDGSFVPLHVFHLNERCPEIVKYFGLAPGWRFLIAPGYEDVWYDANLLNI